MSSFENFPEALRAFRRRAGWTQAMLANRIGVSPNTVSQYEQGRIRPGRAVLVNLLDRSDDALRADLEGLLGSEDLSLRGSADRLEKKLKSSTDFNAVVDLWRSARNSLVSALAELFSEDADERIGAIVTHLARRADDPALGPVLDHILALLEGTSSLDRPTEEDPFMALMRRFRAVADPANREIVERHAHAVVATQEKSSRRAGQRAG